MRLPASGLRPALVTGTLAVALLPAALAGCGSSTQTPVASASARSATATLQPCRQFTGRQNFTSVRGTVQSATATGATIQPASGAAVPVQFTNKTRFTQVQSVSFSDLTVGATVLVQVPVLVKTANTPSTARSIQLQPAGGSGQGFGGGTGTGAAPCRPAITSRQGTGGTRLRGTLVQIDANAHQLTLEDATGTDYLLAVTPSTAIVASASATAADVKAGESVVVTGMKSNGGVQAMGVIIGSGAAVTGGGSQ